MNKLHPYSDCKVLSTMTISFYKHQVFFNFIRLYIPLLGFKILQVYERKH